MPKQKLTKRADGRYEIKVYIGIVNNKKKYKTVYGNSPKEVKAKADEIKSGLGKGLDFTDSSSSFEEWTAKWLKHIKGKKTENQYQLHKFRIEHFGQYLNPYPVLKIKLYQIQEVIDDLEIKNPTTGKPSSKKTLISYKSTINQFFEYLEDNRVVEYNPSKNVLVSSQAPKDERRALTKEEQKRVREFEHRAKLPAMIAMYCGLRRGEITALLWSDIDFERSTIRINKSYDQKKKAVKSTKTESGVRVVTMPKILSEYLQTVPKKSMFVVCNTQNQQMLEGAWERLWKSYMDAMNEHYGDFSHLVLKDNEKKPMVIDKFSLHCLRHTYATMLYDAGVDILTAKKLLGHSDVKTTLNIYTHLSAENERINIDKLNAFLDEENDQKKSVYSSNTRQKV